MDEAEQDMLGADVVVVQHPGLFLSQDHHPPRPVGKPLEHLVAPHRAAREGNRSLARPFRVVALAPGDVPHATCRTCNTFPVSWAFTHNQPKAGGSVPGYAASERPAGQ